MGSLTSPTLRNTAAKPDVMEKNIKAQAVNFRYSLPKEITCGSSVNMPSIWAGKSSDNKKNNTAVPNPNNRHSPNTLRKLAISLFPQSCAVNMAEPLPIPNKTRMSRKKTWPASPTAAIEASPSWPTITFPTMFNEFASRFCKAIGKAKW